jgi:hypothetical protein
VFADVAAEAMEYKPAPHGMQAEEAEAPVPPEKVPATQFWQVAEAVAPEEVE